MEETATKPIDQEIGRLQQYIAKVEEAQKIMRQQMKDGSFEAFTEEQIRFHLSRDPDAIAESGLFLAKLERAYEYAKTNTQIVLAQLWDRCNKMRNTLDLTNAKDRESWVKIQPEYKKVVLEEAEWKYRVAQMKVIYNRYENLFTGTRKLANMIEADTQNNYRREKYGNS